MATIVNLTHVQGNGPLISKIEVRAAKRIVVTYTLNGTTEVVDLNFSNLTDGADTFPAPGGQHVNALQQVTAKSDDTIMQLVNFLPVDTEIPAEQTTTHESYPAYPYLADGETETPETITITPSWLPQPASESVLKADVRSKAVAHARACMDAMHAGWVIDNAGAFTNADRWRNTRLWILSGLAVIDTILKSSEQAWGYDAGKNALDVYRVLMPSDRVATWYFAHSEAIWKAYFTESSGNVPAYFNWSNGADIPAFASDASSSTAWDGTGNTLDVDFAVDATPEDFI